MKRRSGWLSLVVGLSLVSLALAACGGGGSSGSNGDSIKVGMILSYTGNFATQAKDFENGFLAALDYRTKGTMTVNGHKIEILRGDDTGDPAVGTSKAKELLGQGAKVLAGPTNSTVALAVAQQAIQNQALYLGGTSGTADLVGMDDLVFATSGSSPAGSQLTKALLGDNPSGKTLAVVGQDYAYGQDFAAQLTTLVKPLGVTVKSFLLPQTTTDFTPLTLQLKQLHPDYLTTSWAGAGQDQLFNALGSQGITAQTTMFVGLLLRSSFAALADSLGAGVKDAVFTTNYFQGVTSNSQEQALEAYAKAHNHVIEYDDAVGWHAGEMLVHAIDKGGVSDTQAMAAALKDWTFEGPAGEVRIRGTDNQVTVPGFTVHLVKQADGSWFPLLVKGYAAKDMEPPVVRAIKK
jgi:branched-chain amino acid transport system substrate-binding protein